MLRWLSGTSRVHLEGAQQLPKSGAILVTWAAHVDLFQDVYAQNLGERHGLVVLADTTGAADDLRDGFDVLVTVEPGAQALPVLLKALYLARIAGAPLFPVGVGVSGSVKIPGQLQRHIVLPGAHSAVVFDAPFQIPERPEHIPEAWARAVMRRLEATSAQAQEYLVSRQQSD